MLQLAWPWALAALVAPFALRRLLPPAADAQPTVLWVPFFHASLAWGAAPRALGGRRLRGLLALVAWTALVVAGARPQWIGHPLSQPVTGRDIILAIDLSGSMGTQDHFIDGRLVDRFTAVKRVAGEFIERRIGDRVGLVLFGSRPYIQVPLTFDRVATRRLLEDAVIGLAGSQTAIGDAIGLAVHMLRERPTDSRVLVLLTDGENTFGRLQPLEAARFAQFHGLRIHTVGLGGASDERSDAAAAPGGLDERTLLGIARATGGSYFRAEDTARLEEVYRVLDELEPAADHDDIVQPPAELFHWPLGFAYLIAAGAALGSLLPRKVRAPRVPPGGELG